MHIRSIAENKLGFKQELRLHVHNSTFDIPFQTYLAGIYCAGPGVSSLSQQQISTIYKTFKKNVQIRNGPVEVKGEDSLKMLLLCWDEFFELRQMKYWIDVNMVSTLDFERSPFYVLLFALHPSSNNYMKFRLTDITIVIIEVENVDEPPIISDCRDEDRQNSPTIMESNADLQSLCNLTMTFDDRQEWDECKVSEICGNGSRFLAALISRKDEFS